MSIDDYKNYCVEIEEFARRHYIKVFYKKYKNAWDVTETAIIQELTRISALIGKTDKAEKICIADGCYLVKLYFKIAGTKESAKSSGDRAIIFVDSTSYLCRILLVYSKNEICSPNETQKWQKIIKENFPAIWEIFNKRI